MCTRQETTHLSRHPGRRIGPALIAVLVVLAGLVGTGAYFVVKQMLGPSDTVVAGPSGTGPVNGSAGPASGPGETPNQSGTPGRTQPSVPIGTQPAGQPTSPDACPAATIAAVKAAGRTGNLKRVLHVLTADAQAWICQDTDGSLYYQGHVMSEAFTATQSRVTILLGPGIRGSVAAAGVGYRAVDPATEGETQYIVTREVLTVITPAGAREERVVTKYSPTT